MSDAPAPARRWPRRLLKGVLIVAGVWLALEVAWWAMWRARVDQPLADANRIVVRVDGDTTPLLEKQITDPAAIARIRAYVEARPGRWAKTWHTPPAANVRATFYRDDRVVGWFGAGFNFFQAPTLDGPSATRAADTEELEEFERLLGVPRGSHLGPPDHRH
jgi:hypothetical protein